MTGFEPETAWTALLETRGPSAALAEQDDPDEEDEHDLADDP